MLEVDNNPISSFPESVFPMNFSSKFGFLSLKNTNLTSVPKALSNLTSLTSLQEVVCRDVHSVYGQSINIFKFDLEMFLYIYFYMLCVEVYWHVIYCILLFYPSILMVQVQVLSDYG